MAYTERYVTQAAGGGGAGTSGDPWTYAEAFTNAVTGDRVNIKSDSGYTTTSDHQPNAGTSTGFIIFRGYDTTFGDLDNLGRNADGSLNITGFPVITVTEEQHVNSFIVYQNLVFTAAISDYMFLTGTLNNIHFISCKITNTQNNSLASLMTLNLKEKLINCDFECTGASHATMIILKDDTVVYGCRFKPANNKGLNMENGALVGNVFIGSGIVDTNMVGVRVAARNDGCWVIANNTFYNFHTAIELDNIGNANTVPIINNHVTDCAVYIQEDQGVAYDTLELNNRTRDNTTPRASTGDNVVIGEVTTDTGGPETDYTDESTDDLSLITGAPGRDAGMGFG